MRRRGTLRCRHIFVSPAVRAIKGAQQYAHGSRQVLSFWGRHLGAAPDTDYGHDCGPGSWPCARHASAVGGLQPPWSERSGLAELAAFLLLGATFFGLAYTFWQGGHIRVTLLLQNLPKPVQRLMDILAVIVAAAITAFAVWHSAWLTWDSYDYGDLSIGMVPVPLWIPQAVMVLGLVWLLIALVDALVSLASGRISKLDNAAPQE